MDAGLRRRLFLLTAPAIAVGVIFEVFLGHRHDYAGHYAAGYGGTLAATMLWLRTRSKSGFADVAARSLLPVCLACIALGAVAEATAFRIAQFDPIDFFNQSLGAVLAAICSLGFHRSVKPPEAEFDYGLLCGIFFLGAGACFAVA